MENKRIVDINIYWAEIIRDTAQFGQIAVAENPEFNRLSECIFRALEDSFIHSATEYGVKRWENMLQIAPSAGETLDERKARILTYLNLKLPYTWRMLKQLIEGIVGAGKVALDLINDETKLVVHTDRISDEKAQVVTDLIERVVPENLVIERYNHNIEISWRDINKYAHCQTYADMVAVNPDFANDLTSDGEWVYPLPEVTATGNRPGEGWYTGWWAGSNLKKAVLTLPKCTSARCTFAQVKQEFDLDLVLPIATYIADLGFQTTFLRKLRLIAPEATTCSCVFYWNHARQHDVYIYAPKAKLMHRLFDYCPYLEEVKGEFGAEATNIDAMYTNCPKLRVFPTYYPKASTAANMLHNCQITGQQAIEILTSIPTWTDGAAHPITMGIHVNHRSDADVLAAIENAEAKGWTVTVQWNGTPTSGVSTLDLEEIYAKAEESEYGEYTDENGNRCTLSWGHDVKSPDGQTPADLGYKLFFSLVEAEQYFKLTKIEGIENE